MVASGITILILALVIESMAKRHRYSRLREAFLVTAVKLGFWLVVIGLVLWTWEVFP